MLQGCLKVVPRVVQGRLKVVLNVFQWGLKLVSRVIQGGFKVFHGCFNPNQAGEGGQICPQDFQTFIPQEPKVRLTSNQAVNSSLSVVSRSKKKK